MTIRRFLALALLLVFVGIGVAQTDQPAKPMGIPISPGTEYKIHDVQQKYPLEARKKGIQGDVLLQATIDTKGHIGNNKAIQGEPILVEASIDAVRKWRYRPYLLKGKPMEVETTIKIQFRI